MSDVKWSGDGPGDSDQATLLGKTLTAWPDGRWQVVTASGLVLFRGEADDVHAAREAAFQAVRPATVAVPARTPQAPASRPRRAPADQLDSIAAKTRHTRALGAARRTMRRPTGDPRELLESRLSFAQRDLRFAESVLADAQALPGHYPSKPGRVLKATAQLELAQAQLDLATLNLELG